MHERAVLIAGSGLLTSVGLSTASAAAALRCRINRFERIDAGDDEHRVTAAPLPPELQDTSIEPAALLGRWMAEAAHAALDDVAGSLPHFAGGPISTTDIPVLACLMEPTRAGRPPDWDRTLIQAFMQQHGSPAAGSRVFAQGNVAAAPALQYAQQLLYEQGAPAVLITAADSQLLPDILSALNQQQRCLGPHNPEGFIPGEAAAALLLLRADEDTQQEQLYFTGAGQAQEQARLDNDLPSTGQGLTQALRQACADAKQDVDSTDLVLADLSGEAFYAEEHTLASLRAYQSCPETPALWLPAESLGHTGAASGLIAAAWLREAQRLGYAPGFNSLCQLAGDAGQRAAIAFAYL
jgi:3-oxoacyl-[acyl-carrier-protein] synthase I